MIERPIFMNQGLPPLATDVLKLSHDRDRAHGTGMANASRGTSAYSSAFAVRANDTASCVANRSTMEALTGIRVKSAASIISCKSVRNAGGSSSKQ
jgi:hypothetical protein